jgi:hypothetical protein
MDNDGLEELIERMGTGVKGEAGCWQFTSHGVEMVCVTDEQHDRMRVMTPIARLEDMQAEEVVACLQANFDRALDARYCLQDGLLWGAFLHPLRALSEELFESALRQVAGLRHNYGTSYSSGELVFGGD